jgi:allantoate deiminase
MLFVRSPGGVSHSPDERVLERDVQVALEVVVRFLDMLAGADVLENGVCSSTILPEGL